MYGEKWLCLQLKNCQKWTPDWILPKRGLQIRLPAKEETMQASQVAKGLLRLKSLPASFL